MNDTPRTDAVATHYKHCTWQVSYDGMAALARELEREIAEIAKLSDDALAWEYWRDRARRAEASSPNVADEPRAESAAKSTGQSL